uniref:LOB domain-containing protein n=1 Tax=Kalanchoe fedtschenkoi TaxID=63787 RepID=A0A7N0RDW1_KALFE
MTSSSPDVLGNEAESLRQGNGELRSGNNNAEVQGQLRSAEALGQGNGEHRLACAACKHQRKRCDTNTCVFQPYFPGEKKEEFDTVHRFFGVIKVKKLLEGCEPGLPRQRMADELKWISAQLNNAPIAGPLAQFIAICSENQTKKAIISQLHDYIQNLNGVLANSVAFCSNCGSAVEKPNDVAGQRLFPSQSFTPDWTFNFNNNNVIAPHAGGLVSPRFAQYRPQQMRQDGQSGQLSNIDQTTVGTAVSSDKG